jgi:hypothetical protein
MFFPALAISAAAIGLVKFGMLIVMLSVYKAMLAVTAAIALLLALVLAGHHHKDSQAK